MSGISIDIERVAISLYGVSSQVVEAAAIGLEAEAKRRLGSFAMNHVIPFDLGDLALSPLCTETVLDASALRGIIADHLAEVITQAARTSGTSNSGGL